jgi:hypothetical protein
MIPLALSRPRFLSGRIEGRPLGWTGLNSLASER